MGTGLAAAVNVILNVICIRKFGYLAAAYTTMVTYLLYFLFHYVIAWKIRKESLFDTKRLFIYIGLAFFAALVALALIEQWLIRWGILVVLGIYFIVWLEREFDVVAKLKKKFGK